YIALAFAILARSVVSAAFPDYDDSRLVLKTSPDSVTNAKRSLRVAGQEVVQSNYDGVGGIIKAVSQSVNKVTAPIPNIKLQALLEKAKVAKALKNAGKKVTGGKL
ncbi:hypothetical protein F442_12037, partial [Phytophthora nicotianae P10297]